MTYSMLTGWYDYNVCKTLAHLTAGSVGIHVILVMIIFFFLHDGSDFSRYRKENVRVIVQRISGLAMVALLHSHVKNYSFIMSGDPFLAGDRVRVIILAILFFFAVFLHLTTSVSRALVTLGWIREMKSVRRTDAVLRIGNALLLAVTIFAVIRFVAGFGGHA